jgi:putative transposase
MPEHVHLLLSEPERATLAVAIQALKVSFVRRIDGQHEGTFWQKRYYDHNIRNDDSFAEKLRYIHRNPMKRGLCATPMGVGCGTCAKQKSRARAPAPPNRPRIALGVS